MLPDLDGFEVCRRLRADGRAGAGPVPHGPGRHRGEGARAHARRRRLRHEAVQPRRGRRARVRAILRRANGEAPSLGAAVRATSRWTRTPTSSGAAGTAVDLSPTEYKLLRYLLINAGRVVTRAQILDHVWEYDFGGEATVVETYVSYLRKKLDPLGDAVDQDGPRRRLRPSTGLTCRCGIGSSLPSFVIGAVLVVAGVVVAGLIRGALIDQVDRQLERTTPPLGIFIGAFEPGADRCAPGANTDDQLHRAVRRGRVAGGRAGVRPDGRSPSRHPTSATCCLPTEPSSTRVAPIRDGGRGRRRSAIPRSHRGRAERRCDRSSLSRCARPSTPSGRSSSVEVIAFLAVLLTLCMMAWWLLHHGVRPIEKMARTASAIADGDLSRRVAPAEDKTEVGRLGIALEHDARADRRCVRREAGVGGPAPSLRRGCLSRAAHAVDVDPRLCGAVAGRRDLD